MQSPPIKMREPLAPPPNFASKDLRVLLTLRHKSKVMSKGKVTADPIQDAVRVKGEQATDMKSAAAGVNIADPKYNATKRKPPHLAFSVAELKQEVEMSADIEVWRRTKQHGIESLVDPMVKNRRFSQMSTEAGNQLLHNLEQTESPRRQGENFRQKVPMLNLGQPESPRRGSTFHAQPEQPEKPSKGQQEAPAPVQQAHKLDKKQVQAVFDSQDPGHAGFLKLPQIQGGLQRLGLDLTVEDVTGFMRELGVRPNSSVDPQEFAALVGVICESRPKQSTAQVLKIGTSEGNANRRSSSSSSSSSSSDSSRSESSIHDLGSGSEGEYSVDVWGTGNSAALQEIDRSRLRSPRATNAYADDVLQNRLKAMERELRDKIDRDRTERRTRFQRELQRGNIQYIAPERNVPEARALYSGPVNSKGLAEGVGCFDYKKFVEQRGHVVAERRLYYAGVVVEGMRQGLGLLRWMDQTEYCGSWDADVPHGSGLETYTDGSWYAGGFQDDKRHGMGGVWTNRGMVYLGQWNRGVRHGIGVMGHTDVVLVDRKGKGEKQEVALSVDMSNMKLSHAFPPLSNRRGEMREDVMKSIFDKRYNLDTAQKVVPYFIVEYDRGVQTRSIWYSSSNEHHSQLWRDAVHAAKSSQVVALEALELAKEGLTKRRQAIHGNNIRRRREQQQLIRAERVSSPTGDRQTVRSMGPSLASTRPIAQFDVIDDGLRVDRLTVTVVDGKEMPVDDADEEGKFFVVVTLDEHRRQTAQIPATTAPSWDETFSFPIISSWSDMVCSVYRTRKDSQKRGKEVLLLRVTVVEARGLKALDAGGSSDPYAVVKLGEQRFTTAVVKKDLNPVWDMSIEVQVDDPSQKLEVSVWDQDIFNADDLIGKVELSLEGRGGQMAGQEWHDLMDGADRNGQIFVALQLPEWTDQSAADFLGEVRVPLHTLDAKKEPQSFVELDLQSLRPDKERVQRRRRGLSNALLSWTWFTPKKLLHSDVARIFVTQWYMIVQSAKRRKCKGTRYELVDGLRKITHDTIEPRNIAQAYQGSLRLQLDVRSSLAQDAAEQSSSEVRAITAPQSADDGSGLLRVKLLCGQRLPGLSESARVYCKLSLGSESVTSQAQECCPSAAWNESFFLPLHAGSANLRVEAFQESDVKSAAGGTQDIRLGEVVVSTADMECGHPITTWHPIHIAHDAGMRLLVRVVETRGIVKHKGWVFAQMQLGSIKCSTPPCKQAEFKERSSIPYSFHTTCMDAELTISLWQRTGDADASFYGQCNLTVREVVHGSSPEFPFDQWLEVRERVSENPEVVWGEVHVVISVDVGLPPRQGEIKLETELLRDKDPLSERPPRPNPRAVAKGGLVQITVHEATGLLDTDLAGLVCDLRVGNQSVRTEVLEDLTDCVWDQTFLMDTPLNPQILKATVIGRKWLLRLNVIKAVGLKAMDIGGTSDPYAVITLGETKVQTAVIKKELNPTWDVTFDLVVRDPSDVLEIAVFDQDLMSADDLIGKARLSLLERAEKGRTEEWCELVDDGEQNGKILLGMEVVRSRKQDANSGGEQSVGFVEIELEELEIGTKTSKVHPLYLGHEHFTLSVTVLEGNGLISVDSIASDPYVVVSLGSQSFSTPVVKQECDPVWENERFTFRVASLDSLLTCDVYDYNVVQAHVFMGRFTMSAADIVQGEAHERDCPLRLKPDQRDAVQRRVKEGESLGSLKLAYKLVKTSVPSCSLHLSILPMRPPQFSRPHRQNRLIAYRAQRGVGTLEITVVGARAINGQGHHGVYCEVLVGEESTVTRTVKAGQTPTWDEAHSYSVAPGTAFAKVRVLSKGKRGHILLLGEAVMLLSDFVGKNEVDVWNRLDGRYKLGRLLVRMKSAAGLLAADPSGFSDPFAQVSVGKRKRTTKVKKKTLDPVWEEEMLFDIWSVLDVIKIEVFDWDRVSNNDLLGLVELPMERVLRMCKDGERLGEGHAEAGLVLPLTGIHGTPFVDEDRLQRATGNVSIEVEFRGDYGLLRKVGWLRTVANYVSPALSTAQAADMDMALVDQRQADEDDAVGGDSALEDVEQQLRGLLEQKGPSKAQLTRKMIARPGLNPDSLQAQIDLFTNHGGKVLGPYQAAVEPSDANKGSSQRFEKGRSRRFARGLAGAKDSKAAQRQSAPGQPSAS